MEGFEALFVVPVVSPLGCMALLTLAMMSVSMKMAKNWNKDYNQNYNVKLQLLF